MVDVKELRTEEANKNRAEVVKEREEAMTKGKGRITTAGRIIDQAVAMEEGKSILITCASKEEMEVLRVQLYKRKQTLRKRYSTMADMLHISREVNDETWTIIIAKERWIDSICIIDKDGKVEPFPYMEEPGPSQGRKEEVEDLVRVVKLMKKDGKSEEEISTFLAEQNEKTFDKAASKLENKGEKQ